MDQHLQEKLNKLSEVISAPNAINKLQVIRVFIEKLLPLLRKRNLGCKATVKINAKICVFCRAQIPKEHLHASVRLNCNYGHFCCNQECLKAGILLFCEHNILYWENARCCECLHELSTELVHYAFGGETAFNALVKEKQEERRPKFDCLICMQTNPVDEAITLECNHRYCFNCVKQFLEVEVREGRVAENNLKCPDCNAPIDYNIISHVLEHEDFARYEDFALRNWQPEEQGVVDFQCPGPDCKFRALVPENFSEIECPNGHKFCPRCKEQVHKGSTCEAFAIWKQENGQADVLFENLVGNQTWVRCPWCQAVVERTSGCNYMTCNSDACRGRRYFCYACGQRLGTDHAPHRCA